MTSSYPELTTADVAITLAADRTLGVYTLAVPHRTPITEQMLRVDLPGAFAWAAERIEAECEWLRVREDLPPDQTWRPAAKQPIKHATVYVPSLCLRVYELTPFIPPGGGMNPMVCSQREQEKMLKQIEQGQGFLPLPPDASSTVFMLAARGVIGASVRCVDRAAPESDLI